MSIVEVTLNPSEVLGQGITLTNNNLTMDRINGVNGAIRATHGKSSGKWYWEVKLDSGAIPVFIGISNKNTNFTAESYDNQNTRSYYTNDGNKHPEGVVYGSKWAVGDIIGIALDLDNGKLEFYKNGVSMGISHTNLSGLGEVFPTLWEGNALARKITFNFGASVFIYPIPNGYKAYNYNPPINKTLILQNNEYKKWNERREYVEEIPVGNIIPTMVSNTSPNGEASDSEGKSTAFNAFDKSTSTNWFISPTTNGWLTYKFEKSKIINKFTITGTKGFANTVSPKNFTFQGSNDNVNFTILSSYSNIVINDSEKKEFTVNNINPYTYYRLHITANNGHANYIMFSELEMMGNPVKGVEAVSPSWKTVSTTLPTSTQFIDEGMDSLTPLLDRAVQNLNPQEMTLDSTFVGEGKLFRKSIDLNKYFDLRTITTETRNS